MRYEFQYTVVEEVETVYTIAVDADSLEEAFEINEEVGFDDSCIEDCVDADVNYTETLNVESDGLVWSDDPEDR